MQCVFCKREISEDSKFCEYCGTKVEIEEKNEKQAIEEMQHNTHESTETVEAAKSDENLKIEKSIDKRIYKWKEKLIDLSKKSIVKF